MNYILRREQWIARPIDEVFAFFADAHNLEEITPPWLGFKILSMSTNSVSEIGKRTLKEGSVVAENGDCEHRLDSRRIPIAIGERGKVQDRRQNGAKQHGGEALRARCIELASGAQNLRGVDHFERPQPGHQNRIRAGDSLEAARPTKDDRPGSCCKARLAGNGRHKRALVGGVAVIVEGGKVDRWIPSDFRAERVGA